MDEFELMLQGIRTNQSSTADGYVETKILRLLGSFIINKINIALEIKISASKEGVDAVQKAFNILEPREKMSMVLVENKQGRLSKQKKK
ncbi:MAG: hypothetical protein HeimC3_41020 [Candidatus Heimdallarchaeota archaeon LC_3]|nr:MAG: hypothetical protein HeimC3_41020 [Candidatus Heimdallarchaeota archaeon LC_3]